MAVPPISGVGGPDWSIALPEAKSLDSVGGVDDAVKATDSKSFGGMLVNQIGNLQSIQTDAATQSQALATGKAEDASQVVMSVERAQLAMQLAAQLRDKGVESFQEIFRTQV